MRAHHFLLENKNIGLLFKFRKFLNFFNASFGTAMRFGTASTEFDSLVTALFCTKSGPSSFSAESEYIHIRSPKIRNLDLSHYCID